jgi:hypothetical protein
MTPFILFMNKSGMVSTDRGLLFYRATWHQSDKQHVSVETARNKRTEVRKTAQTIHTSNSIVKNVQQE